jgi:hypothetical protein
MGFPRRAVFGALTCLMLVMSFGACEPDPAAISSKRASPSSTSLPLQKRGMAVGGDVQSRATDVVSVRLTKEQTEELVDACRNAVEVASAGDGCGGALEETLDQIIVRKGNLCGKFDLCVKVKAFGDRDIKTLGDGGYVEIVDHRKGKSLCESEPSQVCLRVGIRSSATLRRIAEPKPSPTSSASTLTPSPTPSPTTTSSSISTPNQTGTSPASPAADEGSSASSSASSSV